MGKQSFKVSTSVDTSNNTNTNDNCTALTQHSANIKQGGGRGVVHPASDLPPTYTDAEERHKNTKDILVAGFGGGVENQAFEDDATAKKKPRDTNDAVVGDLPEHTEEEEKQQWARPIEFLLSCIAMSVGLGNVWRFPKTAYDNGGGAFLIPYLFILTFIGRPLYFMELSMGQFSSYGSVKMWKVVPAAKGVGYGQMIATWSVVTYYCAIMGMTVFYFLMSFNKVLPWSFCDYDSWADENCVDAAGNFSFSNESESSSEQYFYKYVLRMADNIDNGIGLPDWRLTLCLLFSWFVLFLTLYKGVKSSGKVAYFTALFPYVVLFTLLGRGASLPGAVDGILYFITPQWHKLLDPNVWYAAVAQSFFSLSVGFGAIINLASFNSFKHNVYRDAWIISLADTLTSFLAGFTIFAILGNLAYELDTDVENVVRGGSGLAFVSYPDALAKFTWAPQLFAVLFFLMLFTLGVGSAAGLTSNIITIICEQFPSLNKAYATIAICITGFFVGLVYITPGGQWILDLVDFFGGGFIIYILVIVETVAINYIYGTKRFLSDLNFMLNIELGLYWKFCWTFIIPVGLTAILIYSLVDFTLPTFENKPYPDSAYLCGWLLAVASLGMVPLCFFHAVYNNGKSTFSEKVKNVFQPKDTWGPKKRVNREEWKKLSQ